MPVASGSVIVWSAVRAPANNVSSFVSAALPSNITPLDVDTVSTLFVVVVPVTWRSPGIITVTSAASPIVTSSDIWPNLVIKFVTLTSTSVPAPISIQPEPL